MKTNSRLSLALHTLSHMANEPDRMLTSAEIAEHAGTNPVVVRRVLGRLRSAGLLLSQKGHAGGWRLAQKPQNISLADVYLALEENLFASGAKAAASTCSIEDKLRRNVAALFQDAEQDLISKLASKTIAQVAKS